MYKLVAGTGPVNVDLTGVGLPKKMLSWHFSNTTAAAVINLHDGSLSGPKPIQIQIPIGASASETYPGPIGFYWPNGVFVEIVTGTIVGSIDLI